MILLKLEELRKVVDGFRMAVKSQLGSGPEIGEILAKRPIYDLGNFRSRMQPQFDDKNHEPGNGVNDGDVQNPLCGKPVRIPEYRAPQVPGFPTDHHASPIRDLDKTGFAFQRVAGQGPSWNDGFLRALGQERSARSFTVSKARLV
jgi:hypothetical protein